MDPEPPEPQLLFTLLQWLSPPWFVPAILGCITIPFLLAWMRKSFQALSGLDEQTFALLQKHESLPSSLVLWLLNRKRHLNNAYDIGRSFLYLLLAFCVFIALRQTDSGGGMVFPGALLLCVILLGIAWAISMLMEWFLKGLGEEQYMQSALHSVWIFVPLVALLYPLTWLFHQVDRLLHMHTPLSSEVAPPSNAVHNTLELHLSSQPAGKKEEMKLLKSIMLFSEKTVTEIMCPRGDIVSIQNTASFEEVKNLLIKSGYSRIPVYQEDLDYTIGFLYAKDILPHMQNPPQSSWESLIRKDIVMVPEAQNIHDLLRTFQSARTHLAMVVDEYGSITGLVTLEDIMEEIIGDIRDETDDITDLSIRRINANTWIMDGKVLLNDMSRSLEVETSVFDNSVQDAETLAGMLIELTGEMPRRGMVIEAGPFTFTVRSADSRRIKKVLVQRNTNSL